MTGYCSIWRCRGHQYATRRVSGRLPRLLPAVRSLSNAASYALARVDRTGADIEVVGMLGTVEQEQVQGEHDVLHLIPGGGWSQRRYQARVEDSWQHSATDVANELANVLRAPQA